MDVDGAKGTIYKEEKFKLQFVFKDNYPAKAPTVSRLSFTNYIKYLFSNLDNICTWTRSPTSSHIQQWSHVS